MKWFIVMSFVTQVSNHSGVAVEQENTYRSFEECNRNIAHIESDMIMGVMEEVMEDFTFKSQCINEFQLMELMGGTQV